MNQGSLTLDSYDAPGAGYRFDPLTAEHRVAEPDAVAPGAPRVGFGATVRVGRWPGRSRVFVALYLAGEDLVLQVGDRRFTLNGGTRVEKEKDGWRRRILRVTQAGETVLSFRYRASWQETDSVFDGDLLSRAVEITCDPEAKSFALRRWRAEREGRWRPEDW